MTVNIGDVVVVCCQAAIQYETLWQLIATKKGSATARSSELVTILRTSTEFRVNHVVKLHNTNTTQVLLDLIVCMSLQHDLVV